MELVGGFHLALKSVYDMGHKKSEECVRLLLVEKLNV